VFHFFWLTVTGHHSVMYNGGVNFTLESMSFLPCKSKPAQDNNNHNNCNNEHQPQLTRNIHYNSQSSVGPFSHSCILLHRWAQTDTLNYNWDCMYANECPSQFSRFWRWQTKLCYAVMGGM